MDNKKQTIKLIVKKKPISLLALTIGLLSGSVHAGGFNIPTAQVDPVTGVSKPVPSPLCINGSCATEFTAKMFTFEEFGTFEDTSKSIGISSIDNTRTFPAPADCTSGPDGALLDGFLKEKMNSIPVRVVDETIPNPWEAKVNECLATKTATLLKVVPVVSSLHINVGMSFRINAFFNPHNRARVLMVDYVMACSCTVMQMESLARTVCIILMRTVTGFRVRRVR